MLALLCSALAVLPRTATASPQHDAACYGFACATLYTVPSVCDASNKFDSHPHNDSLLALATTASPALVCSPADLATLADSESVVNASSNTAVVFENQLQNAQGLFSSAFSPPRRGTWYDDTCPIQASHDIDLTGEVVDRVEEEAGWWCAGTWCANAAHDVPGRRAATGADNPLGASLGTAWSGPACWYDDSACWGDTG